MLHLPAWFEAEHASGECHQAAIAAGDWGVELGEVRLLVLLVQQGLSIQTPYTHCSVCPSPPTPKAPPV